MHIDVIHDTVCPWCRIGARHLELALAEWQGEPVTVRYRPFFLHPGMPEEGRAFADHLTEIKGDSNYQPLLDRVCAFGEQCGVAFNWDKVERSPNTLLSHCLIAIAPPEQQERVAGAVHKAYFEDGRDIGSLEVLVAIAEELGFDAEEARTGMTNPEIQKQVANSAAWARSQGVTGVPFFVIGGQVALSGAQPPEALLEAMREVAGQPGN